MQCYFYNKFYKKCTILRLNKKINCKLTVLYQVFDKV